MARIFGENICTPADDVHAAGKVERRYFCHKEARPPAGCVQQRPRPFGKSGGEDQPGHASAGAEIESSTFRARDSGSEGQRMLKVALNGTGTEKAESPGIRQGSQEFFVARHRAGRPLAGRIGKDHDTPAGFFAL